MVKPSVLLLGAILTLCVVLPTLGDPDWKFNVNSKSEAVSEAASRGGDPSENLGKLQNMFQDWMEAFGISYDSAQERQKAFQAFAQNMKEIWQVNSNPNLPYWMSGNAYSGMDYSEFQSKMLSHIQLDGGKRLSHRKMLANDGNNGNNGKNNDEGSPTDPTVSRPVSGGGRGKVLPSPKPPAPPKPPPFSTPSLDWVAEGKVGAIRNQGQCGSCWAFAAASAVESMYLIAYGLSAATNDVNLSEQQLNSCDTSSGGCAGGSSYTALNYVKTTGITTEARYPYTSGNTGSTGTCSATILGSNTDGNYVKLTSSPVLVATRSETALKTALLNGPVVFYFMAASSWQSYSGGIYVPNGSCTTSINHAMVIVGFDDVQRFWIVRNSWGTSWGSGGYARVAFSGDGLGPCGMYQYLYQVTPSFTTSPLV